ncbi:MAG: hypothetical protein WBG50_02860, partial [Desulfomonilaceae bacterium]
HGGRGYRRDGVDVASERPGQAVEDHILDAGHLEEGEAQGVLVHSGLGVEFQVDPIPVGGVVFLVAAADNAMIIGHQ